MEKEYTVEEQLENAIKWIDALLSGNYKQAKGVLGDNEKGFCCWGLGCYITNLNYDSEDGWDSDFHKVVGYSYSDGSFNDFLRKDISLYGNYHLANVNDNTNAGFKNIGKFLIEHSSKLFVKGVGSGIKKHYNLIQSL